MSRPDLKRAGTWAGILGFFLAAGGVIGAIAKRELDGHDVPLWPVVATSAIIALLLVLYGLSLRRSNGTTDASVEVATTEAATATGYLSNVDDFMAGIRTSLSFFGRDDTAGALARLERVRQPLFDSVIQGINSERGEHVRCVFFKPVDDAEHGRVLRPDQHHGHTQDIDHLWLWPDHRSVAGTAFATGEEVYLETSAAVAARLQQVPHSRPMGSLLCIPAFGPTSDDAIGVFSVDSNRERAFQRSDREFASVCASTLALVDFLASVFATTEAAQIDDEPHTMSEPPPALEAG